MVILFSPLEQAEERKQHVKAKIPQTLDLPPLRGSALASLLLEHVFLNGSGSEGNPFSSVQGIHFTYRLSGL